MEHLKNCPAGYYPEAYCICEPREEYLERLVIAWEEFELNWKHQVEDRI